MLARSLLVSTNALRAVQWQGVRSLFIRTHTTPNPQSLKFTPGMTLTPSHIPAIEVSSIKDALVKSDLAFKLLALDDKRIDSVMIGSDFITISKSLEADDWVVLKPMIFEVLSEHLAMGLPAIKEDFMTKLEKDHSNEVVDEDAELDDYDEIVMLIKELIQTRIRPAILEDGGDVIFCDFDLESGTVYLKLIGACKSCGSSEVTLKNGIEEMLRYYIDEVKSVKQLKDEDDDADATAAAVNPATLENVQANSFNHTHTHSNGQVCDGTHDDLPPSL